MLPGNRPSGLLALRSEASFNQTANLQCRKQTSTQANLVSTMRPFSDITANQIIPQALSSRSSWWQFGCVSAHDRGYGLFVYSSNEILKETVYMMHAFLACMKLAIVGVAHYHTLAFFLLFFFIFKLMFYCLICSKLVFNSECRKCTPLVTEDVCLLVWRKHFYV